MIVPDVASFERVVLTVARPSPVAAAISPAVIALPSCRAARTAALVAPGAVRARAGVAAGLAGACADGADGTVVLRVRVVRRVAARELFAALWPAAERLGVARPERSGSLSREVSAASTRRSLSISPSSSSRRAWISRRIWSSMGGSGPCVWAWVNGHRNSQARCVSVLRLPGESASTPKDTGGACLAAPDKRSLWAPRKWIHYRGSAPARRGVFAGGPWLAVGWAAAGYRTLPAGAWL